MSHVPTVLKSDRSVFDKMLPVDDYVLSARPGESKLDKQYTVNSEIFARDLFSRNFAKFRENKTLAKWQNHSVVF